jgi:N-acetylglucosamine-6-phosphate deacetylase
MIEDCFCFTNAFLCFPDEIRSGELYVKSGKIVAAEHADKIIDCKGLFIAPGLIDLQVNGVEGIDFSSNPEMIAKACDILPRYGVTSFLATIISQAIDRYMPIDAPCLGIHLEGPYLNSHYAGAHDKGHIVDRCTAANWKKLLPQLKMMTLAPELEGSSELISWLIKHGVVACCGHSAATSTQLEAAEKSGLSMVTHLFNAMVPFHQRAPGIIGYTLAKRTLFYSVIADGVHLADETIQLAYNAHPDGLILVSDCNSLLGASHGTLGSQPIEKVGKQAVKLGTHILAGSAVSLFECMANFSKICRSLVDAVASATIKPAKLLGIDDHKGRLDIGCDADFIIFSDRFKLFATYKKGVCAFTDFDSL